MPNRELRLAFAMGGGVSLGTFSGAALGEAIKLAVRAGVYQENGAAKRYDRVVIDVFSGSSAGAMSLAIMLRALAHQSDAERAEAAAALRAELGADDYKALGAEVREDLLAAQVCQARQERVWGRDITLAGLLGNGPGGAGRGGKRDLTHIGSVLDRREVDAIAAAHLALPTDASKSAWPGFERRRLLGDRVLFACTISNLTPIRVDASREYLEGDAGLLGLSDGATSDTHRELRVFDLNFVARTKRHLADDEAFPRRWCRYHCDAEKDGWIGDLRLAHTWAKIGATAIASGAFPIVFEPVVLKRSAYEFGAAWPPDLPRIPDPFDPKRDEIPRFEFSYVDGGTFNNEPIREAFRLAAFLDAASASAGGAEPGVPFDRRVIYVDPMVDAERPSFRLPVHREYVLEAPGALGAIDGHDLARRSSLDRLLPHFGTVFRALMNEARVSEADKIAHTTQRFDERERLRAALAGALSAAPDAASIGLLKSLCAARLEASRLESIIPPGTLSLAGELRRVNAEDALGLDFTRETPAAFLKRADPAASEQAGLWQRALAFVAIDLVMDLAGKSGRGRLIAIAPIPDPRPGAAPILLPGGRLQGFAGFASLAARPYEIAMARHCARRVLEETGLVPRLQAPPFPPTLDDEARRRFDRDLEAGLDAIASRLLQLVRDSHALGPLASTLAMALVGPALRRRLAALATESPPMLTFEFRLEVPDETYELDGSGLGNDIRPIRPSSGAAAPPTLITIAAFDPATGRWSGPHIDEANQTIPIDRAGLADRRHCALVLPDAAACTNANLYPSPQFAAKVLAKHAGKMDVRGAWGCRSGVIALEDQLFQNPGR